MTEARPAPIVAGMRIAIFVTLLLVALAYAAWKGGGPERAMVGIAIVIVTIVFLPETAGSELRDLHSDRPAG